MSEKQTAKKNIRVTQTRSAIRKLERQRRTLAALGLGRIGRSREFEMTPSIEGMLVKVAHLVQVEEV